MTRGQRWALHVTSLVLTLTGVVYFVMKDLMTSDDPLALVNHPLQPLMLHLHVLAAPAAVLTFGIVYESHIAPKIRSGYRFNRRTGLVALATFILMTASGYLLQVVTQPALMTAARIGHLVSAAIFSASYLAHLVIGLGREHRRWSAPPVLVAFAVCTVISIGRAPSAQYVSRQAYLMGTLATLTTVADTRAAGLASLDTMLRTLEETEAELSTWRANTTLARVNAHPIGVPYLLDRQTCELVRTVWYWQRETRGAFDPGIAQLIRAYNFRAEPRFPTRTALERALRHSGLDGFLFDANTCRLTRTTDAGLEEGAFGKGEALDRARAGMPDGSWMVDLGGQVAVQGRGLGGSGWDVAVADPRDRRRAVFSVVLARGSLATSGGSERDTFVDGQRVGHILDPRTGRPAAFDGSVAVWHERALVADILSTALFVMGPKDGRAWADARGIAACFLQTSPAAPCGVSVMSTRAWQAAGALSEPTSAESSLACGSSR
ncbi:MAG: FAD:protein FMN transferase [Acidobacteria bacterium]|nr:FAD:protein FMN transferase [Acidobacteriota bacterium]MBI3262248.1 FAD:protein FMN transferase [Acidobacteriota bacterium]